MGMEYMYSCTIADNFIGRGQKVEGVHISFFISVKENSPLKVRLRENTVSSPSREKVSSSLLGE